MRHIAWNAQVKRVFLKMIILKLQVFKRHKNELIYLMNTNKEGDFEKLGIE